MPNYAIEDPITGTSVKVSAERAPTQEEAMDFLKERHASMRQAKESQSPGFAQAQASNEANQQANIEQVYGGIPFYGAPSAASEAYKGTTQLLGESLPAQAAASLAGLGGAIRTLFNPITKAGSNIPRLVQGTGEQAGTLSTGDLSIALAQQTITGEREVQPLINFNDQTDSTIRNLAASGANFVQTEPVNAFLALEGARRGITAPKETFSGLVEGIKKLTGGRDINLQDIPAKIGETASNLTPDIVKRVGGGVKDIVSRKQVGTLSQDVFKPTTDTAKAELNRDIESGALHDDLRNIAEFGKPKTAEQMLENGIIAKNNLINLHEDFASQFPTERFSNSDIASQLRQEASSKELSTPQEKNAVSTLADKIDGERSLEGSFKLLQKLNDRRRAYYEKSSKGQATDLDNVLNEAEQKARDQISTKLDDFYRLKTGATDNPYKQYGSLSGRLSDLTLRLNDLLTKRGIEVSKGLSLDREVLSTIKRNASLLKGGEKARIDSRISKMFDSLGKEETTNLRDLTPEDVQALQDQRAIDQATAQANIYGETVLPEGVKKGLASKVKISGSEGLLQERIAQALVKDALRQRGSNDIKNQELLSQEISNLTRPPVEPATTADINKQRNLNAAMEEQARVNNEIRKIKSLTESKAGSLFSKNAEQFIKQVGKAGSEDLLSEFYHQKNIGGAKSKTDLIKNALRKKLFEGGDPEVLGRINDALTP